MRYSFSLRSVIFLVLVIIVVNSCSKGGGGTGGGGGGGGGPIDPCASVSVTVSATTTNPTSGSNGSINATASGGSSAFTFSLNGGTFQSSGNFTGLGAGTYTITAKNASGCVGSNSFVLTAPVTCTGTVTITVSTTVTGNRPCELNNGSVTAFANGGSPPYSFNINGGGFQATGNFIGLGAGSYTIIARDANGCTGSTTAAVVNLTAGSLFTAVRNLLQAECVSCHNNSLSEGGMNWQVDCNIVDFKDRIKARAVDGNPSSMPPTGLLPASERTKITSWISAGGRFTD